MNANKTAKPRSATVECLADSDFITFDKESFDKILSKFYFLKK